MNKTIRNAIKDRRTYYAIGNDKVISNDKIVEITRHAVQYVPSAFNSQSARVLVLMDAEHDKLWEITKNILKGIVTPEQFPKTEKKIDSFKSGYGTILYFEDQDTVAGLQDKFPSYRENFPLWSLQSSGMLQYGIWTMLESAGLGVSLQHYNPLIDEKVRKTWNIPASWKLISEMPFGKPMAAPDAKTFLPLDERIRVFE